MNSDGNYIIPKDNPFVHNKNARKEIWSYGFRNVWRFSFDKETGDMYLGDVGQNNWEEIDWQPSNSKGGYNYGWNILEGNHCYPEDLKCDINIFDNPIFEYPNNAKYVKTLFGIKQPNMVGCSITGGYVYRGKAVKELYGRYLFGDYCTGKVWSILIKKGEVLDIINHTDTILDSMGKKEFYLSSFGEDNNGELFLIDYNGTIYKLINI